ncbi:MAG: tetratricopeptide repeat protein [bacterium]
MAGMHGGDTTNADDGDVVAAPPSAPGARYANAARKANDAGAVIAASRASAIDRALLVACIVAVAILLAAASLRKIGPPDYWWQLATGEYVLEHGPPRVDPFSYTRAGEEWIELHWLYCVYLHHVVHAFGARGATIVVPLVVGSAIALLAAIAATRRTAIIACAVVTIAILAGRIRFYARPEIFTFLFIASFLWILTRFRRRGGAAILALPVLQAIWTNFQALSILGPCLVGACLAASIAPFERGALAPNATRLSGREFRTLAAVLIATLVACLVNPYGVKSFTFPLVQFSHLSGTIFKSAMSEFVSPFSLIREYAPIRYYLALIAIAAATTLANFRRVDLFLLLVAASQLYLSTLASRNVPLFALAAIPLILDNARKIAWGRFAFSARGATLVTRVGAVAIATFALVSARGLATNRFYLDGHEIAEFGTGVAAETWPGEAVAFARESGVPEPIFALMRESSFLIAEGFTVAIDPRLEVYGDAFFERYLRATADPADWEAFCREFGVRATLIGLESLATIDMVRRLPQWELVYFDAAAAIFVRPEEAPRIRRLVAPEDFDASIARLRSSLPPPRPYESLGVFDRATSPRPYHLVADFLMHVGLFDRAEPFLRDAIAAYPGEVRARTNLAMALEFRGDKAGAARELEAALRWAPRDADIICQAALRFIESGDLARAAALLDRAIEVRPSLALAWALRGEVDLERNEAARAVERFERALALAPGHAQFAERLAAARAAAAAESGATPTATP